MCRTIISPNYSGTNITIRALGGAIACAILFFFFVQTAGPTEISNSTRNIVLAATAFGLALFITLVLRFVSLRWVCDP